MSQDVRASLGHETESAFATVTEYIAQVGRDNSGTPVGDDLHEIEAGAGVDNSSDDDLARLARLAIERNAFLAAGKVRPAVRNGWLILVGEVEGPIQKRMAEDAVRDLDGIRGVSNNILIESDALAQRVGRKIDEAFVRSALFSAHHISITASDHKIILSGCVRSLWKVRRPRWQRGRCPGLLRWLTGFGRRRDGTFSDGVIGRQPSLQRSADCVPSGAQRGTDEALPPAFEAATRTLKKHNPGCGPAAVAGLTF